MSVASLDAIVGQALRLPAGRNVPTGRQAERLPDNRHPANNTHLNTTFKMIEQVLAASGWSVTSGRYGHRLAAQRF